MTPSRIRLALKIAYFSGLIFTVTIFFALVLRSEALSYVAAIASMIGALTLMFGVMMPLFVQWGHRNILDEKSKNRLQSIALCRFVVNIEKEERS